ncbi:hypothetical protein Dip518_001095 [Parelusimicrobium proximum]|uniref:hypothetical protein n=1 Tax=Parelusimicrobium proximum TaxID=3228953 RepID=UPI003D1793F5
MNSIVKILLKAAALVAILIVVFLLLYPHACTNFLRGEKADPGSVPASEQPSKDKPLVTQGDTPVHDDGSYPDVTGGDDDGIVMFDVKDYDDANQRDYQIAKRYLELEYAATTAKGPLDKEASEKLIDQVVKEFGITDEYWNEVVDKANARGWIEMIRKDLDNQATTFQ